jgi:ABC-type phosphate transport system substrate-binding protein
VYAAVIGALLYFRVLPSRLPRVTSLPTFGTVDTTLVLAGTSTAPGLVDRAVEEFGSDFPRVVIERRQGGTRHGLEDLVNGLADVVFLSRLPTPAESEVLASRGDSVATYPVALGGIAVVVGETSALDNLSLDDLRRLLGPDGADEGGPLRAYVPDPNLGLWDALAAQLGLPGDVPESVRLMAGEKEVLEAVSLDPRGVGFASTLVLPADLVSSGVRFCSIRRTGADSAFVPSEEQVAVAEYPLHHHLYVACRPTPGGLASSFITFLVTGRGQRMIGRWGYLPARDVPRLVQITSEPVGGKAN